MTRTYFQMKSNSASAPSANAAFACAHSAHNIVMILGAIIVASIIICALAVRLSILALLVLVLLAVLLVLVERVNMPTARLTA